MISLGLSARLNTRFGARAVLLCGLPLLVAGLAVLSGAAGDPGYVTHLMPVLVLLGVGAGLALPAVTTLAMSGVIAEDSGAASGLANTTQQVGGAGGVALAATLATWRTSQLTGAGHAAVPALLAGYHLALGAAAGVIAVALVVAATALRSPDAAIRAPITTRGTLPAGAVRR